MNIWNGQAPQGRINGRLNPLHYIKRTIISQNLRSDLNRGRTRTCSFASIFLTNVFAYQKTYHIVSPFDQLNCFASPDGRKRFIKALLHPCSYMEDCPLWKQKHRDICDHLINACPRIPHLRKKLQLKLTLYNYPSNNLPLKKAEIIRNALRNSIWRKCFTEFLTEIDY